jgi:hypothetical protein
MWIDANERLGPESITGVNLFDLPANIGGSNLSKRAREALIIADKRSVELEDVH